MEIPIFALDNRVLSSSAFRLYCIFLLSKHKRPLQRETMKGMTINHQDIWTQFGGIMEQIEITEDFAQDIANALNEVESKAHGTTTKQIDSFKAELAELDLRQDRFVNLLADGTMINKPTSVALKK